MNALQIHKAGLDAAVRLDGGGLLAGRFFVQGDEGAPIDALLRLLNDPQRQFFPFAHAADEKVRLLSRAHVDVVWPTAGPGDAVSIAGSAVVEGATIDYGDGAIRGVAFVGDMHPDRRRLLDLLNDERPFFVLRSPERTYLVNKARVRSAFVDHATDGDRS